MLTKTFDKKIAKMGNNQIGFYIPTKLIKELGYIKEVDFIGDYNKTTNIQKVRDARYKTGYQHSVYIDGDYGLKLGDNITLKMSGKKIKLLKVKDEKR